MIDFCNTFWGSHGCGLEPNHEGEHRCIDGHEGDGKGYVTPEDYSYLEVFSLKY